MQTKASQSPVPLLLPASTSRMMTDGADGVLPSSDGVRRGKSACFKKNKAQQHHGRATLGSPIETPRRDCTSEATARRARGRASTPRASGRGEREMNTTPVATGRRIGLRSSSVSTSGRKAKNKTASPRRKPIQFKEEVTLPIDLLKAHLEECESNQLIECRRNPSRQSEVMCRSLSDNFGDLVSEFKALTASPDCPPVCSEVCELARRIERQSSVLFSHIMYALDVSARRAHEKQKTVGYTSET